MCFHRLGPFVVLSCQSLAAFATMPLVPEYSERHEGLDAYVQCATFGKIPGPAAFNLPDRQISFCRFSDGRCEITADTPLIREAPSVLNLLVWVRVNDAQFSRPMVRLGGWRAVEWLRFPCSAAEPLEGEMAFVKSQKWDNNSGENYRLALPAVTWLR